MARMFPERVLDPKTPASERRVFDALQELDDEWMVFHSVAWQGWRRRGNRDGEADFVLAHPSKGALILEVKGGGISIVDGQWLSTDRHGKSFEIDPFGQLRDNKHFLGEFLAERLPRVGNKVQLGHAAVFPDIEVTSDLSAEAPREVLIDRSDLRDIVRSVDRVASHWNKTTRFDQEQFSALRKAIAPSRKISRRLRHEVEDRVEDLIRLTDQQLLTLYSLRHQRRSLVTGGAGTGKTVLALERARQLADEGREVLLLCYNAPLGAQLREKVGDSERLTAGNFHSFARGLVSKAGLLPAGDHGSDFWDTQLANLLPDAAAALKTTFDAIIIDEGQDFVAHWWTALELLLTEPEDSFMYVFADMQQDLYRSGWKPPFEGQPIELALNCRNTIPIAEKVNKVFERDEPCLGTDGPEPRFVELASPKQAAKKVGETVARLLSDGGMRPTQVTVLSPERQFVDALRGQKVGDTKLVAPGEKGVVVETVQRFKGLENDAVVLVIPDSDGDVDRPLAYVGMSRARVLLFVLGSSDARSAICW